MITMVDRLCFFVSTIAIIENLSFLLFIIEYVYKSQTSVNSFIKALNMTRAYGSHFLTTITFNWLKPVVTKCSEPTAL